MRVRRRQENRGPAGNPREALSPRLARNGQVCTGVEAQPRRANPCQRRTKPLAIPPSAGTALSGPGSAQKAPVAQLDRAPDYESGGQEFESLRARQRFNDLSLRISAPNRHTCVRSWLPIARAIISPLPPKTILAAASAMYLREVQVAGALLLPAPVVDPARNLIVGFLVG